MQELMLLHSLSRSATDALFNQFRFEIRGAFDPDTFRQAWQSIIDRHAALRTAFIWQDVKQPLQVVRDPVSVEFHVEDLRAGDPQQQSQSIDEFLDSDSKAGFHLQRAPLMRFCLFQLADDNWHFVWTSHHLIVDRWCLAQIHRELDHFYSALTSAPAMQVLPRAPGYKTYIEWLSRQDRAATLAYWTDVLSGYTQSGSLFDAGPGSATAAASVPMFAELQIDAGTAIALDACARKHAVTASIVTQAAWAVTLNHRLRSQDVVFGLTVSGRPTDIADVESIVGSFINNIPVRATLSGSKRVVDWLRELQARQFERSRHEYLSSAELKRHMDAEQQTSEFESLLVWLAEVDATCKIDMQPVSASYGTAYPLTISILQRRDGMMLRADTSKTCSGDLQDLLDIFAEAIQDLVAASADSRLCDLPLFSAQPGFVDFPTAESRPDRDAQHLRLPDRIPVADVAGGREKLGTDVLRELVQKEWSGVLAMRDLDADDDFFAIGGTSARQA